MSFSRSSKAPGSDIAQRAAHWITVWIGALLSLQITQVGSQVLVPNPDRGSVQSVERPQQAPATQTDVATLVANSVDRPGNGGSVDPPSANQLPANFLQGDTVKSGAPALIIGYYNMSDGLLAGYQSRSGKRIVLRANWRTNGQVNPQVGHLNSTTGKVELLMGRSRQIDAATGKRAKVYEVAGVDFLSHFQKRGDSSKNGRDTDFDAIDQFMDSAAGRAYSEAIPALYATLEALESDVKLAELQAPFGGILTALQLNTGVYTGFDGADSVLGTALAGKFREACLESACKYRGRHFRIQNSGLFDVLTDKSSAAKAKSATSESTSAPRTLLQVLAESRKNGNGICETPGGCFGGCGPGCFTPGDIYTTACWGHDWCVCKWGDAACTLTVPEQGCDGCNSLIEAIGSYLTEFFRRIFEYDSPEPEPEPEEWW